MFRQFTDVKPCGIMTLVKSLKYSYLKWIHPFFHGSERIPVWREVTLRVRNKGLDDEPASHLNWTKGAAAYWSACVRPWRRCQAGFTSVQCGKQQRKAASAPQQDQYRLQSDELFKPNHSWLGLNNFSLDPHALFIRRPSLSPATGGSSEYA